MPTLNCAQVPGVLCQSGHEPVDPVSALALEGHLADCLSCRLIRHRLQWLEEVLCDPDPEDPIVVSLDEPG